ncbi:MAG: hypothetical protein Kow0090_03680 [Myxococcota bacterium]
MAKEVKLELDKLLEDLKRAAEKSVGENKITSQEIAALDKFVLNKEIEEKAREFFRAEGAPKMPESRLDVLKHIARARLEITEVTDTYEQMLTNPPESGENNFKEFNQWVAAHYLARLQKEKLIAPGRATTIFTPVLLYKDSNRTPPSKFLLQTIVEELIYLHDEPASMLIVKALPDMFELDASLASRVVDKLDSFFPQWRDKVSPEFRQHILDIKTAKDIDEAPVTAVHQTESGSPASEKKRLAALTAGIVLVLIVVAVIVYLATQN